MAFNLYKSKEAPSFEVAIDALTQFCRSATQGHAASLKVVGSRFVTREGMRRREFI